MRDETLKEVIAGEYRKNYSVYGQRKMRMHLLRENHLVPGAPSSG